eukprot:g21154.t1
MAQKQLLLETMQQELRTSVARPPCTVRCASVHGSLALLQAQQKDLAASVQGVANMYQAPMSYDYDRSCSKHFAACCKACPEHVGSMDKVAVATMLQPIQQCQQQQAKDLQELKALIEAKVGEENEVATMADALSMLCTKVDELANANPEDRFGAELGTIAKALTSLTDRVDQLEAKGNLEAHPVPSHSSSPLVGGRMFLEFCKATTRFHGTLSMADLDDNLDEAERVFESQYERVEPSLLGEGTYGKVFKARSLRTGELEDGMPSTALREIALLKEVLLRAYAIDHLSLLQLCLAGQELKDHQNIVKLLNIFYKPSKLILVFEFVENDLKKYMRSMSNKLSPATVRNFALQLFEGVQFCHASRILHRDLKPQNLLIDQHLRLKIADFGLAWLSVLMLPKEYPAVLGDTIVEPF